MRECDGSTVLNTRLDQSEARRENGQFVRTELGGSLHALERVAHEPSDALLKAVKVVAQLDLFEWNTRIKQTCGAL